MKTKYITILIITIFLSTIQLMGQCQEDETISTNPNNPINTELPVSKARYLNQFNWAKTTTNTIPGTVVIPINPTLVGACPSIRGLSPTSISHN